MLRDMLQEAAIAVPELDGALDLAARLAAAADAGRVDLTILVLERGGCWRRRPGLGLHGPQGKSPSSRVAARTGWLGCDYLTPLVAGNA